MKDARAKLAYLLTLILCVLFVLGGCSRDGEGGTESGEQEPVPDRSGWLNRKISQGDGDTEFAIVMFDCNRLKTINDRYSHERGDDYLQAASTAICQVYSHSPVFRLAGMSSRRCCSGRIMNAGKS